MTTVIQQLKEKFPEIFPIVPENDRYATYTVLHHFSDYCAHHFEEAKSKEILNIINTYYHQKNLLLCNAIENEFLSPLAIQLGVNELMKQLEMMPQNLWSVYIKVLIETQKTLSQ